MTLKAVRESKRLTQNGLAEKSGIAQSTIHYIESGKQSPTERTLKKLAAALEVNVTDLITDEAETQHTESEVARP